MSETTQPSLLSQLRDPNNAIAWKQFHTKYRDLILRYCRYRNLQASDAEDVLQLVMLNLTKSLPRFQYNPEKGRFRSYLGAVVRNTISHHVNRPSGAAATLDTYVLDEQTGMGSVQDPNDPWEHEWVLHHYRMAMQTIRNAFDTRSVQAFDRLLAGDTVMKVAESFGMSLDAVHKIKQRIRDRLRLLIADQVRQEDEF